MTLLSGGFCFSLPEKAKYGRSGLNFRVQLQKQRAEKHRKEELLREHGVNKASEAFIDSLYYYEMYCSLACWKTVTMVDRELRMLKSKTAKLNVLKENIRMRVLGLGWKDLSIPWSKQGNILTVNQLTTHLKSIILQQKKKKVSK